MSGASTPADVSQKIEAFFAQYPKRSFKKGDMMIFAGEPPEGVFRLVEGQVRQYDIGDNGDEVVVNVFKPMAFFPMTYAINKTPNEYFYSAATLAMVQVAPAEAVFDFVRTNPDVAFDLLSRILRGLDGLVRRQAHLMGGTAPNRLLYELILSCRRYGDQQADGSYFVALKETELAARAGLTRETVNRQLKKLKDAGLVLVVSNGLKVTNFTALEEALGRNL